MCPARAAEWAALRTQETRRLYESEHGRILTDDEAAHVHNDLYVFARTSL